MEGEGGAKAEAKGSSVLVQAGAAGAQVEAVDCPSFGVLQK